MLKTALLMGAGGGFLLATVLFEGVDFLYIRISSRWHTRFWGCKLFINRFFVSLALCIRNSLFSLRKLRNVGRKEVSAFISFKEPVGLCSVDPQSTALLALKLKVTAYFASFSNTGTGSANGPTRYNSSLFHAAWKVAAVRAIINHTVKVAKDSATFVSLS